jgi:endonuclease/exonuclease/phosphatase family metal-dependent hydrolase
MYRTTDALAPLPAEIEVRALGGPATSEFHDEVSASLDALNVIEVRRSPEVIRSTSRLLRLGAWNMERCKFPEQSAKLLSKAGVKVALLSEMDYGMARSGNLNTTQVLAEKLGFGHAFVVEFAELGLGNPQELLLFEGSINSHGYHGNAVATDLDFRDPHVTTLGKGGSWFSLDWHHRRLGSRIAISVTVELDGAPIKVVSVHLENLSSPDERRQQMQRVLSDLDRFAPGVPAVIAGDLNTAALPDPGFGADWFDAPGSTEPLFDLMADAGFDWRSANTTEQTRRIIHDGRPHPLPRRIDWFFVRGLQASNPCTWAAEDEFGVVLSDHELITVDVALA